MTCETRQRSTSAVQTHCSTTSALILLTVGLLALRVAMASVVTRPTIMMDERCYLTMAKAAACGRLPYSREYGPLYPALIAPVLALSRSDPYRLAQVLGCVVSVSVVPLGFILLRKSLPDTAALQGAALIGVLPSHLLTSPLLMAENLFFPLLLLIGWAALSVVRGGRHELVLVLSCAAAVLTKKLGWAVVVGVSVFLLLSSRHAPWTRRLRVCCLTWLGAAVASVAWAHIGKGADMLCQGLTPTTAVPATSAFRLAQGTFLRHLLPVTGHAVVLGAVAWVYWMAAHVAYLALACMWVPVLARPWRKPKATSLGVLALCVAVALMAFSSHHNLDGWQRDQYIRGRYVDGALPLLLAASVVLLFREKEKPGGTALAVGLLLALLLRPQDAAHGQNRNLAWLSPFLSGPVFSGNGGVWAARTFVAAMWVALWVAARRWKVRRGHLLALLGLFVLLASTAGTVRLLRQQAWARDYSSIALWLRDQGPRNPLIAVEREETSRKDKELGLAWVMEQILFWTDASFVRGSRHAGFLLTSKWHPFPVLSVAHYGDVQTYYLYDRRNKGP